MNGSSALNRENSFALILLFAIIAYFPVFLKLDVLPLRIWDEARNAVSAYEMYTTGDLLVAHYKGEPDMWGVKPPFLLWMQTLFFHVLGPGELAVRLPAAIAALLTGWLLFRFCWKDLGRPWLGILGAAVLFSSEGFINMHGARSGDHDVPVTFFMFLSLLMIFKWCLYGRRIYLLWFFLALALGTLTKSVQALMFAPGILVFLLVDRKIPALLRQRNTYLGIGIFIIMVGAFYLGREAANPGYLQAVWENELWGRYTNVLEQHDKPWDHYFRLILERDLDHFYMWVPAGLVLGLLQKEQLMRRWTMLITLALLGHLLVISSSSTKLDWYIIPSMPLLAALCAIAMHTLLDLLIGARVLVSSLRTTRTLPYLFIFLIFAIPWTEIVRINYKGKEWPWQVEHYRISHYLKKATRGIQELEPNVIVYEDHHAHLLFYVLQLNEQGSDIEIRPVSQLQAGDIAILDQWHVKEALEKTYVHDMVWNNEGLHLYNVIGRSEGEFERSEQ